MVVVAVIVSVVAAGTAAWLLAVDTAAALTAGALLAVVGVGATGAGASSPAFLMIPELINLENRSFTSTCEVTLGGAGGPKLGIPSQRKK